MQSPGEPELRELSRGVYAWIGVGGDSNAGAIATPEGLLVIDAQQHEELANKFKRALAERTGLPIKALINTHCHFDHVTGNVVFAAEAPIISHERTLERLVARLGNPSAGAWTVRDLPTKIAMFYGENAQELIGDDKNAAQWFANRFAFPVYDTLRIVPPNQTFADRYAFSVPNDSVRLEYFGPAHCDGDIIVVLPRAKVAFLSDLLFFGRFPWLGDCDLNGWIATLERILRMDIDVVVPGHGTIASRKEVDWFRILLSRFREEVSAAIRRGDSEESAIAEIALPEYSNLSRYQEWLKFNVRSTYRYLRGDRGGVQLRDAATTADP